MITQLHTSLHGRLVFERRIQVLAREIAALLPEEGRILDVGCGNGELAGLIQQGRPRLGFEGIDVVARPTCAIPMKLYDGLNFPLADKSVDYTIFVDVLHHTPDPFPLLEEAIRVSRHGIVIKDHRSNGPVSEGVLRFMDWVGNRQHGVPLPYNYLGDVGWTDLWGRLGVQPDRSLTELGIYPRWARPIFENGLHVLFRIPV